MRLPLTFMAIGLIFLTFSWWVPSARAELSASQVLIIANANSRDSLTVAAHYAKRRGIPLQHIVALDLPMDDTMSREDYDRRLVAPVRQALQDNRIQHSIRVLVTVYGVPLRVSPPTLTAEEERRRRDVSDRLGAAQLQLEEVVHKARDLAMQPGSNTVPLTREAHGNTPYERHVIFLQRIDEAVQESITRVKSLNPSILDQEYPRLETMVRQYQGVAGLAQLHHHLPRENPASSGKADAQALAEYAEGMQLLLGSLEFSIRSRRAQLYQQIEQVYGAYGVFGLASMELNLLSAEHADASVDSELSLLWKDRDQYGVAWRQPNPLYHGFKKPPRGARRDIPLLMVSRLDGPNASVAMRLVDRAMEAEQQGPIGTVYLDARGLNQSDTYGRYDQSLRDLDAFLTEHTTYASNLENTDVRFHRPDEAPDVALYAGWYQLRHYEDAFTFRPGAIGYHMASAEAVSVHVATETGWCKNALERGITATLGSIGEPYLDAFPEPLEFVTLLMVGQYSLVEAYYLTNRWVSWRMVLFGDPLYNPWKIKPAAKRSALTMFPLAPIAPSDQNFDDPLLARDDLKRLREQSRTRLDTILRNQPQVRPQQ